MIETIVRGHLLGALDVPVVFEVPEKKPAAFVLLEKVGSGRRDHVDAARIAVQSWAGSLAEAAALNERAKAAMDELWLKPEIYASRLDTDYNWTEPQTKDYRYQAIYNITYQEEAT